jgi:pyruvate dehydrogenase E1 component
VSTTLPSPPADTPARVDGATLDTIQRRVLRLATSIIHHATTPSGVKVGGYQASSASKTTIMTASYFAHLQVPTASRSAAHGSGAALLRLRVVARCGAHVAGRCGRSRSRRV